jgi:2'-5' RNA ligase
MNEQIKELQEAIEFNKTLIKKHEADVFKYAKEINWLAVRNVNKLEAINRLGNEVEKLKKELDNASV